MNLNRTNAYLKRVMILGGKTLVTQLSLINPLVLGVYADDYLWRKIYKEKEHFIFYEMNVEKRTPEFLFFLKFIRKVGSYKTDYPRKLYKTHVFVFSVRPDFQKSFEEFLKGNYSEMYTKAQLKELNFPKVVNGKLSAVYCTLHKLEEGYEYLKEKINIRFKGETNIFSYPDLKDVKQFDLPIVRSQEILNYKV